MLVRSLAKKSGLLIDHVSCLFGYIFFQKALVVGKSLRANQCWHSIFLMKGRDGNDGLFFYLVTLSANKSMVYVRRGDSKSITEANT
jgi:hypothetical protein